MPRFPEDCLYLNVFAPKVITSKLPVAVFIPGGDFKVGYSGGILYDCSSIVASQNIICVTTNYRLGALGFAYTGSGDGELNGNYGFQDQQFALQWVADNIAAFGGDPSQVTIFGQSAGAASVAIHNVAPSSKGLFNQSYMASTPFSLPLRTEATWGPLVTSYIKHADCKRGGLFAKNLTAEVECLKAVPAADLVAAQVAAEHDILDEYKRAVELFLPWTPTEGTPAVPDKILASFTSGSLPAPHKPLIATTVTNEAVPFVWQAFPSPLGKLEYEGLVEVIFFPHGGKVQKRFPLPPSMASDARPWLSHIATFALLVCSSRHAMSGVSGRMGHYDHVISFGDAVWGANYTECDDKVCHGADLIPLFRPNATALGVQYTPDELNLSASMQDYLGSFVRGGVPLPPTSGPDTGIRWPAFNMTSQQYLRLQTPVNQVMQGTYSSECDFFDALGYDFY